MVDTPAPAARPTRRPLLWIGGILWTAVFAALAAAFFLRGDRSEPDGQEIAPIAPELVAAEGGEAGTRLLPGGVEPKAEPAFDPDGLPPFALTERRGDPVTNNTLEGSPWVAGFVFARCATICPRVTESMRVLHGRLEGSGVKMVSFTVDPEHDTPEILNSYADMYGAGDDEDWLFLTGDRGEIYELIGDGFKQPVGHDGGDGDPNLSIFHTNNLMLVGPDGVVRGSYNSQNPSEMARLRRDAQALAADGGADGAGT